MVIYLQILGQTQSGVRATGNHDLLYRVVHLAQLLHHAAHHRGLGQEENLVAGAYDGAALGGDGAPFPEDADNAGIHLLEVVVQVSNRKPDHQAVCPRPHRHQADPAPGKLQHLQGLRKAHQALHIVSNDLLWANHMVDGKQRLAREPLVGQILH